MARVAAWLAGILAAAAPALVVRSWDAIENASGRDGPPGLAVVLLLLGLAWVVAFVVLAWLAREPRAAGWWCGGLVAAVAVGVALQVAAGIEPDARFVVAIAAAPVVVVCLALGIACGFGVEALRRRSPT